MGHYKDNDIFDQCRLCNTTLIVMCDVCLSSIICLGRIIIDFYLPALLMFKNLFRKISCAILYSFESTLKLLARTRIYFPRYHPLRPSVIEVVKRKI